uniref:PABS domain-containing protein n=1 Tax=Setaria digitata TaxID=48799 RepID=A0A915PIC9_9BILA
MLPSSTKDLNVARSGENGKPINLLWRLALRARVSRHMLFIFKIIIILGAYVTALWMVNVTNITEKDNCAELKDVKCLSSNYEIKLLYYWSMKWTVFVEDQSYGIAAAQGQQVRYLIESRPCSDMKRNCYTVYDAVDIFTGDVNRFLIMKHVQRRHEAVVHLIPPAGVKSKESDSRFWKVNHTHINRQYVAVMLTVPFGFSALALSSYANLTANVLIVGLGGGSMNMFLTSHFPKMTITVVELDPVVIELSWQWFGLKKGENIRIITMDGGKFVEKAVTQKVLFDVVLIDVCNEDESLICPARSFTDPSFIKNLKRILNPKGIVTLNILPRGDVLDSVDEVVQAYQKQFQSCATSPLLREMNTILACQIIQQVDLHTSQHSLSQQFEEAWNRFGFSQKFGVMEMSYLESKVKADATF